MSACSMGAMCCHKSPCAYLDEDDGEKERLREELVDVYDQLANLRDELAAAREALGECIKDLVAYQVNARKAAKNDPRWEGCAEVVQPTINTARAALGDTP